MENYNRQNFALRLAMHLAQAHLNYRVECLGDELAKEHHYPVDGLEAVYLYLMNRHGWTIAYCRSMNFDDLHLALEVEIANYKLPNDARFEYQSPDYKMLLALDE